MIALRGALIAERHTLGLRWTTNWEHRHSPMLRRDKRRDNTNRLNGLLCVNTNE
jgi:hypothetical protein